MKDDEFKDEHSSAPDDEDKNSEVREDSAKGSISADLIRGHINTIILRTLDERDKYGYEIMNEIEEKSHGQYTLKQPTLYSALKRLENQGYIKAYWKTDEVSNGGRRKYFTLTELGREYSEKNQSEWEYSRTVIDSLISDRSFDFSQPAPTPVDFNILKKSVSRVYTGGGKDEENVSDKPQQPAPTPVDAQSEYARKYAQIENSPVKDEYSGQTTVNELYVDGTKTVSENNQENKDESPAQAEESKGVHRQPVAQESTVQVAQNVAPTQPEQIAQQPQQPQNAPQYAQQQQYTAQPPYYDNGFDQRPAYPEQPASIYENYPPQQTGYYGPPQYENLNRDNQPHYPYQQNVAQSIQPEQQIKRDLFAARIAPEQSSDMRSEEEKRVTHENFLRLISEQDEKERGTVPNNQAIDTEKLIYTNKPETERDYKKLVNNIYSKAIKHSDPVARPTQVDQADEPIQPEQQTVTNSPYAYDPTAEKAKADGLKVSTSSSARTRARAARGTTFNKGGALFASSVIVGIILLIEFAVCMALAEPLHIGIMYPLTLLIIAVVEFGVFGIMYACGFGRGSIRPATHAYISLYTVLTVICILVICLVSFLLDINLQSSTDIAVKLIIPSVTALNITIFGVSYYFLSKA